jgi:hypothetical protein
MVYNKKYYNSKRGKLYSDLKYIYFAFMLFAILHTLLVLMFIH